MFQRQALVIGNSAYTHQPRSSSVYDAYDMSAVLRSMGFMTQPGINLKSRDLKKQMDSFVESIRQNSIVLFYFSGLTVQYDGNTYLMPTNNHKINTDTVKDLSVNVDKFIGDINNKKPRAIIVILDCCRPHQRLIALRSFFDKETSGTIQNSEPVQPPPSTIVAYSCALGATFNAVARNGRNSLYTYYLLQYITTPNVDIHTILKYVASNVQRDTNGRQVPDRYSSVQEYICLAISPSMKSPTWFDGMPAGFNFRPMNYQSSQKSYARNNFQYPFVAPNHYYPVHFHHLPSIMRTAKRPAYPFRKQQYYHFH